MQQFQEGSVEEPTDLFGKIGDHWLSLDEGRSGEGRSIVPHNSKCGRAH